MKIEINRNMKNQEDARNNKICIFSPKIDGEYINIENASEEYLNRVKRKILKKYLTNLMKIIPCDYEIVVCLGSYDISFPKIAKEYHRFMGVIAYYSFWPVDSEGAFDEDNDIYILCDKSELEKLFKSNWFSIKMERNMKIFVLPREVIPSVHAWSMIQDEEARTDIFLKKSLFVIENLENGFVFQISSVNKSNDFFESISFG